MSNILDLAINGPRNKACDLMFLCNYYSVQYFNKSINLLKLPRIHHCFLVVGFDIDQMITNVDKSAKNTKK